MQLQRNLINLLFVLLLIQGKLFAQNETEYETIQNISYYPELICKQDKYIAQQCVLDIYYPKNKTNFATVVWFHGGGLTSGSKQIPELLKNNGVCIVSVNYRLHPQVQAPKYIEDAAAAVAWTFRNITKLGGDSNLVFVSGHSAGAYLSLMVGLDKQWLAAANLDANKIAAIISFSGQTITHFTIRKENGLKDTQPVVDKFAPLFHVRSDASPVVLITGDRELELLGRYEENAYLYRMLKLVGHPKIKLYELQGYGHDMETPAFPIMLKYIQTYTEEHKKL